MEDLVLEFEVKTDENAKFKGFLDEVQEKFDLMGTFRKTFQKLFGGQKTAHRRLNGMRAILGANWTGLPPGGAVHPVFICGHIFLVQAQDSH